MELDVKIHIAGHGVWRSDCQRLVMDRSCNSTKYLRFPTQLNNTSAMSPTSKIKRENNFYEQFC